ncbi:MAG TPA: DUF333 domain-containing protein [Providencia sp.]|uniref:DUF333 domain-containing protein n=1 Tax=Providencia sp. TaxID=589 RepID=UPI000E9D8BEF|nr:DUF333 domain-containing protein [Providencia sp.]MBP6080468.1 DUF333 domain-containing protein [Providencia sp.]HBO22932.1 DUF333 domain-containing protein [Providencia sp.]
MKCKISALLKPVISISLISTFSFMLTACSNSESSKMTRAENSDAQYAQQVVNLGYGAQEACVSAGGLPAMTLELNGNQTAVCQFANGKRCAADIIQSGSCI